MTSNYWMVSVKEASWSCEEWFDHFQPEVGRTYESSVIEAADESCLLESRDLAKLFREHGTSAMEYVQAHADAVEEELLVLPLNHAGQALRWLGY